MANGLLVIDPQHDFITGNLPVPHAAAAMDKLACHMGATAYELVAITCDSHPANHCSFRAFGGLWPEHCITGSQGCAIWPPIQEALSQRHVQPCILRKGGDPSREEYSIWQNSEAAAILDALITKLEISHIDICGLAGDICVRQTLKDGIDRYGAQMFTVLSLFSPSLDGGQALSSFCQQEGICIR